MLYALEWPVEEQLASVPSWFGDATEYRRRLEEAARERLHEAVPQEARAWCRPEEAVTSGKAWEEILRVAEEKRSGIVMGVRGPNPVGLAVFGSTDPAREGRAARCS